jgi:CheY-like chemotaxis protein
MYLSSNILLVEDDPGDVRLALAVFRELKLADRCVVVNDGEQALDFLYAKGRFSQRPPGLPRLILLDLKMPRMNGFEFLERIRVDENLKLIPVVALTSSREERDVARAYDLNVNGYVVKSIDFADHRATLQALANYWDNVNEFPPALVDPKSDADSDSGSRKSKTPAFRTRGFWRLAWY